jgi:hypothetical protein
MYINILPSHKIVCMPRCNVSIVWSTVLLFVCGHENWMCICRGAHTRDCTGPSYFHIYTCIHVVVRTVTCFCRYKIIHASVNPECEFGYTHNDVFDCADGGQRAWGKGLRKSSPAASSVDRRRRAERCCGEFACNVPQHAASSLFIKISICLSFAPGFSTAACKIIGSRFDGFPVVNLHPLKSVKPLPNILQGAVWMHACVLQGWRGIVKQACSMTTVHRHIHTHTHEYILGYVRTTMHAYMHACIHT